MPAMRRSSTGGLWRSRAIRRWLLKSTEAATPVEWAVEMARFDEEQTLDRIAGTQQVAPSLAVAVADAILRSHDKAPRADGAPGSPPLPALSTATPQNFVTCADLTAQRSISSMPKPRSVCDDFRPCSSGVRGKGSCGAATAIFIWPILR